MTMYLKPLDLEGAVDSINLAISNMPKLAQIKVLHIQKRTKKTNLVKD